MPARTFWSLSVERPAIAQDGASSPARANLAKDYEGQFRAEAYTKAQHSNLLPGEEQDPMRRWRDRQRTVEPDTSPSSRLDTRSNSEPNWDAWNAWCDQKIANALAAERQAVVQMIAEEMSDALAETRNDLAAEAKELRLEVEALRATLEELRAVINSEKAKVIDLPSPLWRAN